MIDTFFLNNKCFFEKVWVGWFKISKYGKEKFFEFFKNFSNFFIYRLKSNIP